MRQARRGRRVTREARRRWRPAAAMVLVAAMLAGAAPTGSGPSAAAQAPSSGSGSTSRPSGGARTSYDQLAPAADDGSLRVVSLLPSGLLDSPAQGSEIRVQFDRPVVALSAVDSRPAGGTILTVEPAIPGTYRWASTRLLIFTPDAPLSWGRRHTVTVQNVTSIDNRRLSAPVRATFETPVPMCERAGAVTRPDRSLIVAMRCPRVLDASSVVERVRLDVVPNGVSLGTYTPPAPVPADLARILARLRTAATVPKQTLSVTEDRVGDRELCTTDSNDPAACVFVRSAPLPPEKTVRIGVLAGTRTVGGNVAGRSYALGEADTPMTPLVAYPGCTKDCDPDMVPGWSVTGAGFEEFDLSGRLSVTDLGTNRTTTYRLAPSLVASRDRDALDASTVDPLSLRWANLRPRSRYRIRIAADALDRSGQRLAYVFQQDLSLGKRRAGLDGTRGERVLEGSAPSLVGYTVRNLETYQRVLVRLDADAITRLAPRVAGGPGLERVDPTKEGAPVSVRLGDRPDIDRLTAARLGEDGKPGVFLLGVKEGRRQPGTTYDRNGHPVSPPSATTSTARATTTTDADDEGSDDGDDAPRWYTSLVQYTDLGVTIRRAPGNALVAVTSIGSAVPVAGAKVEVRTAGRERPRTLWSGATDAAGIAVVGDEAFAGCSRCDLIAIVTKGDDLAYAQSRWREWGVESPSDSFDAAVTEGSDGSETTSAADLPPTLPAGQRWIAALFADRGVYRLGDEVKIKGVVRIDSGRGLSLPTRLNRLRVEVTDNTGSVIASPAVEVSKLGSFDLSAVIPADGRQGSYDVRVVGMGGGAGWLVTAFRNPDFKVDATLDKRAYITGDTARATFEGGYLFGAPMGDAPVTWTISPSFASVFPGTGPDAPTALQLDGYRYDYLCVDYENCDETRSDRYGADDTTRLDQRGRLEVAAEIPVIAARHRPVEIVAEAEVTDVNRQAIANRTSALVHPGEHYVGVRLDRSFVERGQRLSGKAVAVTPTGRPVPGVDMTARLVRWEYVTAKRQTSETSVSTDGRWVPTEVGTQPLRSSAGAAAFSFTSAKTGYYEVRVTSRDRRGNWIEASTDAYVTGPGYVSWETPSGSEGSLTLVPERTSYRVGETARILVQSPWEQAEALVTAEGAVVFSGTRVAVRGSSAVIEVPVTDEHVPNVLVSVTLYKGRTAPPGSDIDDPGRPMVRASTLSIDVPTTERQLDVDVSVPKAEERPGAATSVSVVVRDAQGRPAPGEATIWAVDEGVLRLTGYTTPDLVAALTQRRWDETQFSDSRMLLLAPVSLARAKLASEKGDEEQAFAESPGGGGDERAPAAPGADDESDPAVRRDFRTLAVWSAAVPIGADGTGRVEVKLPEQLTEFRVIAVAASGAQRFGGGVSSVRTATPFSVVPAMPRFVTLGDTVEGGVVVQNRTGKPANVTVSAQMTGSSPLQVLGQSTISRDVPVGATEIRFRFAGRSLGSARLTFRGSLTGGGSAATPVTDAVQVSIPVSLPVRREVVAASGQVTARAGGASATERLVVPTDVLPGIGGLEITTSSSALAGLQAGIQRLVEYPYGCLEQRTSRLKVLMALRALGRQYSLPSLPMTRIESVIATELTSLRTFQTGEGGLAYWPDDGRADVYLTSRTLVMLLDAQEQGLRIPAGLTDELTRFLQRELERFGDSGDDLDRSSDSLWWNQAQVVYALARAGAPEPAFVKALYARRFDLSPFEQLALLRAMLEAGMTGTEPRTLYSQIRNGLRLEGDRAALDGDRYGDMPCWCIAYLLADDTHLTAELLSIVVRADPADPLAAALARELVARRDNGTWRNTHEDGYALTALVDYGRLAENVEPSLDLSVTAGAAALLQQRWSGRTLESRSVSTAIDRLPTGDVPLTFTAAGIGRINYTARLTYARPLGALRSLDQGFTVLRSYQQFRRDVMAARSTTGGAAARNAPLGSPTARERAAAAGSGGREQTFDAGDIVRVSLTVATAQVRSNVVIEDPLPSGFEAIDAQLSSATQDLLDSAGVGASADSGTWYSGIDRVEIRDDRVLLFATRLEPGEVRYTYLARATAPGRFTAAPTMAAEMYRPELFGRTATSTVNVGR